MIGALLASDSSSSEHKSGTPDKQAREHLIFRHRTAARGHVRHSPCGRRCAVCVPMNAYTLLVRCGCAGGGKGALVSDEVSLTLSTSNTQMLFDDEGDDMIVRRFTQRECERLRDSTRADNADLPKHGHKPRVACTGALRQQLGWERAGFDRTPSSRRRPGSRPIAVTHRRDPGLRRDDESG